MSRTNPNTNFSSGTNNRSDRIYHNQAATTVIRDLFRDDQEFSGDLSYFPLFDRRRIHGVDPLTADTPRFVPVPAPAHAHVRGPLPPRFAQPIQRLSDQVIYQTLLANATKNAQGEEMRRVAEEMIRMDRRGELVGLVGGCMGGQLDLSQQQQQGEAK